MKASVVSNSEDPTLAQDWIEEVEDMTIIFEQLATIKAHPLKRHDVRLFVCVLGAIRGKRLKWAVVIENRCTFGTGRQALRILDLAFLQHGERLAMSSTTELMSLACGDIGQLEDVPATFEQLRNRIPGVSDTVFLELLRRLVKGVGKCAQVVNLHVLKAKPTTDSP